MYVEAEDVRKRPFRVAVAPLPSLEGALTDAVGSGRKGTPMTWRRAIRAQLRQSDYKTLAPFVSPGQTLVPDPLLGLADPPGESLKDGIERMIATPVDVLLAEVEVCRAGTGNRGWEELERDPGRWLRRYVGTLLRAWKGFQPIWHRAQAGLGREVERIGVATALDAQLELVDGLLAHGSVDEGRWRLDCRFMEGRMTFPETGLVLMPLVAGEGGSIIDCAGSTMRRIGYPMPSLTDLGLDAGPAPALEGLLGAPRAQILRALDCPISIGRLAEALRAVPSAATHHVTALEAAGLVVRERCGRQVLVRRMARGEALLALYQEASPGLGSGRFSGGVVDELRRPAERRRAS
jgi:DNA-binding transcriptional ArsR family regulator